MTIKFDRLNNRQIVSNNTEFYKNLRDARYANTIEHFSTPELKYPSGEDIEKFELNTHVWGLGDRFYKLAYSAYGNSELWWVIAWFNKKPTDAHVKHGDMIYIPFPLEMVLASYGY